ncbi:MAG: PIN domain-containing protein, partial [Opitutaceae bacterium]
METHRGAKAPLSRLKVSAKVKTFVLDTNVLLHDPQCVFKFEDNNL